MQADITEFDLWDELLPLADLMTRFKAATGLDPTPYLFESGRHVSINRRPEGIARETSDQLYRHLEIVLENILAHRASVVAVQVERGRIIGLPPEDLGSSFLWQRDN